MVTPASDDPDPDGAPVVDGVIAGPRNSFHGDIDGVWCADGCLLLATERSLRRRAGSYRIRYDDLCTLLSAVDGMCMLCRRCHAAVVEHCHMTGRVRGIVCRWCNTRISDMEGGMRGFGVAYRRKRYDCRCARSPGEAEPSGMLENETYAFLDHPWDAPPGSTSAAFGWLARHPLPA